MPAASLSRIELAGGLLDAAGIPRNCETSPLTFGATGPEDLPSRGAVVVVRLRQYLIDSVQPPNRARGATRVALIGIDDDNQGRRTEVLWKP